MVSRRSGLSFCFQGSWSDFVAYELSLSNPDPSTNLNLYRGSWGVDIIDNVAWAIMDHNGDFAVIPEPA